MEFQCPPGDDHAELIWDVVSLGEHADQAGYDVFTCLEHDWFEQFAIMPAPLPLFATLAQRTRNLTFRAMCHTLPLHNPFVLAGEIATTDILLNGRFEVGVGRGHAWLQDPANIVMEENAERYAECLDILEQAWTEDRFSYDGKYYQAKDLSVVPKPLQQPAPEDLPGRHEREVVPARGAERLRRGARRPGADDGVPRAGQALPPALRGAGTQPYLGWIKAIYLDEDEDRAMEEAREAVLNFIKFNVSPLHSLARTSPEEKQRLIDAGYAFYAADDFAEHGEAHASRSSSSTASCSSARPRRSGDQLLELWDEFRFEELLTISPLRRHEALAVDEDPGAVRARHHAAPPRGERPSASGRLMSASERASRSWRPRRTGCARPSGRVTRRRRCAEVDNVLAEAVPDPRHDGRPRVVAADVHRRPARRGGGRGRVALRGGDCWRPFFDAFKATGDVEALRPDVHRVPALASLRVLGDRGRRALGDRGALAARAASGCSSRARSRGSSGHPDGHRRSASTEKALPVDASASRASRTTTCTRRCGCTCNPREWGWPVLDVEYGEKDHGDVAEQRFVIYKDPEARAAAARAAEE